MKCTQALATLLAVVSASITQQPLSLETNNHTGKLKLSAVVNDPSPPHKARIECWELHSPFSEYPTIGSSMQLANVSNITYVELPADTEGLHNAPHPMLFILLSGVATVTLPDDCESRLEIRAGENSVIVATDTIGSGHYTRYAGNTIVALQAPFRDGIVPAHQVLHHGAC